MSSRYPQLIGLLPTYGRQTLLPSTLRKIMAQTRPPDALVIVDNEASTETSAIVELFQDEFPAVQVRLIQAPENLGSAGGWALAFQSTINTVEDHDWFVTLDDDDPPIFSDELEKVFEFAQERWKACPETAAVGIVGAHFDWRKGVLVRPQDSELFGTVEVDYVGSGHGAMYSAAVVRRMGGFRGELFFGFTEVEYCLRLRREGFRIFAHGDLWRKRREQSNRLNLQVRPSRLCTDKWKKYYSIRNYIFMMVNFRRYDLAIRQTLIQVVLKPLYTLSKDWGLAYRGFRIALRAAIDGFRRNMGRTVTPNDFKGKREA
jgi:GT2 family glycosyltransferase